MYLINDNTYFHNLENIGISSNKGLQKPILRGWTVVTTKCRHEKYGATPV